MVTPGVEMGVIGIAYDRFTDAQREAVIHAYPRGDDFKNEIIRAFYDGTFRRDDFRSVILRSPWGASPAIAADLSLRLL